MTLRVPLSSTSETEVSSIKVLNWPDGCRESTSGNLPVRDDISQDDLKPLGMVESFLLNLRTSGHWSEDGGIKSQIRNLYY